MREAKREFAHIIIGSLFILLAAIIDSGTLSAILILLIGFGYIVSNDLKKKKRKKLFANIINAVERGDEKHKPGIAAIIFTIGVLLVVAADALLFHNKLIVLAALVPLVFGDAWATLIGKYHGTIKLPWNNTLEGTVIGLIVSIILMSLILPTSFYAVTVAAIVAMAVDFLPVEDNLFMPIATGITLFVLL